MVYWKTIGIAVNKKVEAEFREVARERQQSKKTETS